jgi:hypothetical protein
MGFEIVKPGELASFDAIEEGQVSISRSGDATFRREDLDLVKIGAYAIVLADPETLRLAVRAPRDNERLESVAVGVITKGKEKKDAGRRRIRLTRAIKRLDLTCEAVAGRFDLLAKDDLIIIPLIGMDTKGAKPAGDKAIGEKPAKVEAPKIGTARPRFEA